MRTFYVKPLPLTLLAVVLFPLGLWVTSDALVAGLTDSFWGAISTRRREYPVIWLLFSGVILALLGAICAWMVLTRSAYVRVGSAGIQQSPRMIAPLPWSKIGLIEQLQSRRSRFLRKGCIVVSVPDRSDIASAGWLLRVFHWSPRREATIVINPQGYERGDEILPCIERFYPVVRS